MIKFSIKVLRSLYEDNTDRFDQCWNYYNWVISLVHVVVDDTLVNLYLPSCDFSFDDQLFLQLASRIKLLESRIIVTF